MADSEFDELDKAVASVLGTPVAETTPKPVEAALAVSDSSLQTSTPTTVVPPRPVKPAGRFMDIVHPSSDMRPPRSAAPTTVFDPPEPLEETSPSLSNPVPDSAPLSSPSEPVGDLESSFVQPDPLDFHHFSSEDDTPEASESGVDLEPDAIEPDEPAASKPPVEEKPEQPLLTPFLADAKVEKRPLGAFSDAVSIKPDGPSDTSVPEDEPVLSLDETKAEDALPAELHSDLLSIEASDSDLDDDAPTVDQLIASDDGKDNEKPDEPVPPVPSIVQQYKEKPNSNTHQTAAIYDTEPFHVPLVHAEKKKSGWLVVIWIAAIVLVGAGIGAVLYYLVIVPHLT